MNKIFLIIAIFITNSFVANSTTWNEPWQEKVIKDADALIKGQILKQPKENLVVIKVLKTLAGKEIKGTIKLDNFYLLKLCSTSGHSEGFQFGVLQEAYFLLKKNKNGNYSIATPTAGFDYPVESGVVSTYRHSYHHALVPEETYELTMTAIFNSYHGTSYDTTYIDTYIKTQLSLKPAFFDGNDQTTFFLQHVALELIYHLKLKNYYELILPFLNDTGNFHNQISAGRALVNYKTEDCKLNLLRIISDSVTNGFPKVICIWTLKEFDLTADKFKLAKLLENASSEENGFGGSIMDPRVCTVIPTVKSALTDILKEIK